METKQKTLAECRDDYAKSQGFNDWQDMKTGKMWDEYEQKNLDAATELYAGQTKESEPVSIDIIDEAVRFRDNFDYTSCLTSTGIKTGEAVMNSFIAGAKWKSQQPASIAWLSEEEIKKISIDFKEVKTPYFAIKHAQSLLKSRANTVDLIGIDEAIKIVCDERKNRTSNTDYVTSFGKCEYLGSLLKNHDAKIYLTSKTE